jgi:hypothetical protein
MTVVSVGLVKSMIENAHINVGPHRLERDVRSGVVCHHLCDLVDITVPILALMKTEPPVWHHGSLANNFRVLLRSLDWGWASEEVQIQHTTKGVVLEVLTTGCAVTAISLVDLDVHTVGIEEEDGVGTILATMIVVDGMCAVKVGARRSAIGVAVPSGVAVVGCVELAVRNRQLWKNCDRKLSFLQWIGMFSCTVEVGIVRQRSAQTDVLILEDQGCGGRVEEDIAAAATLDGKAEWLVDVVKDELAGAILGCGADRARQDGLGNLVDLLGSILDQDMKTSVCDCSLAADM